MDLFKFAKNSIILPLPTCHLNGCLTLKLKGIRYSSTFGKLRFFKQFNDSNKNVQNTGAREE